MSDESPPQNPPQPPLPKRWFHYKILSPTLRTGLVDMGEIGLVEGTQPTRTGAMTYRLYLRCFPNKQVELDEANFLAFDKAWKAYHEGEL
jgi:hypothetical protein